MRGLPTSSLPDARRRGSHWRFLFALVVTMVVAAACSFPGLPETPPDAAPEVGEETERADDFIAPPTTDPTLPPPDTVPPLSDDEAEALAALPGRIAFTFGPHVGVMNADGSGGTLIGGDDDAFASQPTWSNEGALLAWSSIGPQEPAVTVFDQQTGATLASPLEGAGAFYLQWASDDRSVAYLQNDPGGNGLEAGRAEPGMTGVGFDTGAPYFFDFAPGDTFWVAHVGGDRLTAVLADGDLIQIPAPLRNFSAPMFLNEAELLVASVDGFLVLDVLNGGERAFPLPEGDLTFVSSPDGTKVAYREPTGATTSASPPRLMVMDLETGATQVVTEQRAISWEWSPDSTRLAWMGLDEADAANLAQWHFWSEGQQFAIGEPYRPSDVVLSSYLPFFTQYALSQTRWSPDGAGFAVAGFHDGEPGIFVTVLPDPADPGAAEPDALDVDMVLIGRGDVAVWSPDDARLGGASGGIV